MPLKRLSHRPRRSVAILAAVIGGCAIAGVVSLALAQQSPTLSTAKNAAIGEPIAIDSHGRTVYELTPETSRHLLCTRANGCFRFWPPVTVASPDTKLAASSAIKGTLGILHRDGRFQVTLAGRPLYRFAGDGARRGNAKGQGLHGFGGVWHVVSAAHPHPTTSTATPSQTSSTPYPTY